MKQKTRRTQGAVWGSLLVLFGLAALVDSLIGFSRWLWVGSLAIGGIGVLVVYLNDRSQRWTLLPAYILLALAALISALHLNLVPAIWVTPAVLILVALPFLLVYLSNPSQWWPLIPAYLLAALTGLLLLTSLGALTAGWIATYVLSTFALPFIILFLLNRARWWALIPAYVLIDIGLMVALINAGVLFGTLVPAYLMLSLALPFLLIYLLRPKQWWALIPGGITGVIGVAFLLAVESMLQYVIPLLIILAGLFILTRVFPSNQEEQQAGPAKEEQLVEATDEAEI